MQRPSLLFIGLMLNFLPESISAEPVVVVSTSSPLTRLSKNQIADIFLGKANHFPSGELALPIDQIDGTIVRDNFYEKFTGKSPAQLKAHWSKMNFTGRCRPPVAVKSSSEVKQQIVKNSNTIGYIDAREVDNTVTVLRIE